MGKLYIIPTPIGNLEDITLRALRILKEVNLILAEDTRTTGKLLQHYQITAQLKSYHSFNEHQLSERIADELSTTQQVFGLVSDAGTPGISDPAYLLVNACLKKGVQVSCLPGATAFVPALVNSGFSTHGFIFEGFLPHKKGRKTAIEKLIDEERTVIFYESPHRIQKLIEELNKYLGKDRRVSISREISKMFEETLTGTLEELLPLLPTKTLKGEIVVCVEGK